MDDDFFLDQRVAIVGLGLMGGSLALALRGYCPALIGVDRNPETLALAEEKRVVDLATNDLSAALDRADLVVLAAPVRANLALLAEISQLHSSSLMLLDMSSTKSAVVTAMNRLPERFSALGGHPMCGKETSGLAHADGKLYWDAPFVLTETKRTTPELRAAAETMVAIIGGQTLWLDAATHDRWAAEVSHLPYLVSAALAGSASAESASLVSSGFLGASRLAASDVTMMLDILVTNRDPVLAALEGFQRSLDALRQALHRDDEPALRAVLSAARDNHARLVHRPDADSLVELGPSDDH